MTHAETGQVKHSILHISVQMVVHWSDFYRVSG